MPVIKVSGGYKAFASSKKVFKTKKEAERALRAIKASQSKRK